MTFAHLPSGYVLAFLNEKFVYGRELKKGLGKRLVFLSTVGAAFPDIDTIPFLADGRALSMHRRFATHTPFPYVLVALMVYYYAGSLPANKRRNIYLTWFAFLSGVGLHFLTDSFLVGIRWLYPVSESYFALVSTLPGRYAGFGTWLPIYLRSPFFIVEIVFFALAAWLYWKKRFARD